MAIERRGAAIGWAIAAVGVALALILGWRFGLFGSPRPITAAEVFSKGEWQVLAKPDYATVPFGELRPEGVGLVGKPGVIPLDPQLLERLTFVGLSVKRLDALLGPAAAPWIPNQPFGGVGYRMHPPADRCHTLVLILTFEPDRNQVPVVVSERLEKRSHCVE